MDLLPLRKPDRAQLRVIRAVFPALLLVPFCFGQSEPPAMDATAVVRRAVANRFAADAIHQPEQFALHKQDERHNITQKIIETPQGDVALLVAVNGLALSAQGRQAERARLDLLNKHPEYQEHRRKREEADAGRVNSLLRLLPDAFLYQYEDTEACNVTTGPTVAVPGLGQRPAASPAALSQCYRMSFKPNPTWDPPNIEAKILRGMAGEIWIEKSSERLHKLNAQLVDDVDFGWGIVGRLDKGGTVSLEQTEVGDHDWELTRMRLDLTGKALMVKPLSFRMTEELGHFEHVPAGTDYHAAIRLLEAGRPGTQ